MENIRKRSNIYLETDPDHLLRQTAKPTFVSCKIFHENLVAVHMKKKILKLDKPSYVGMCILDLSKVLMYDFHYNFIKAKYGDLAKLLFTDTDSLCYHIITNNKTAKGVKKNVIKRDLDHSHYLACLQNNTIEKHKMKMIRSDHHVVSSYEINKTSLSCFDDKRYILDDGKTSYAYGHALSMGVMGALYTTGELARQEKGNKVKLFLIHL